MPAIYFPDRLVRWGFKRRRRWKNVVEETPTGQRQARPLWTRYRRGAQAILYSKDEADFTACRETLDQIKGALNAFYIYMWDAQKFNNFQMLADHDWTQVNPNYTIPFKESTLTSVKINGNVFNPNYWSLNSGTGPGGEDQINVHQYQGSGPSPVPATGDLFELVVSGRERLCVVKTSDIDDFDYLYEQATPTIDVLLDVEEQPAIEAGVVGGTIVLVGGVGAGEEIYRADLTGTFDGAHSDFTIPGTDTWVAASIWLLRNGSLVNTELYSVLGTGNRTIRLVEQPVGFPVAGERLTILGKKQ